ncbi:hypothetical protein ACFOLA_11275 [Salinicoccus hispanicus]|uniref:Uncharacterized protein n=1 Tax=Salinicoccus hispanicus TaxID=157225 RepID=A0A6N8U3F2_9STAP|nr:hypothetical protein [Salinicoccus hispanicus]MXQ50945.1 hypothetical protein [Salinicoccus hispanicus]
MTKKAINLTLIISLLLVILIVIAYQTQPGTIEKHQSQLQIAYNDIDLRKNYYNALEELNSTNELLSSTTLRNRKEDKILELKRTVSESADVAFDFYQSSLHSEDNQYYFLNYSAMDYPLLVETLKDNHSMYIELIADHIPYRMEYEHRYHTESYEEYLEALTDAEEARTSNNTLQLNTSIDKMELATHSMN